MPEPSKKRPTRAERERDAEAAVALMPVPETVADIRNELISMYERMKTGEYDEVLMQARKRQLNEMLKATRRRLSE